MFANSTTCEIFKKEGQYSEPIKNNEKPATGLLNLDEHGLAEDIGICQSYGPEYEKLHKYIAPRRMSIYGPLHRYGPKRAYPIEIPKVTTICRTCKRQGSCPKPIEDNGELAPDLLKLSADVFAEDIAVCQSYGPEYEKLHKYIAPRRVSIYGPLCRYGSKRGYPVKNKEHNINNKDKSGKKRMKKRKVEMNVGFDEKDDDLQKIETNVKET